MACRRRSLRGSAGHFRFARRRFPKAPEDADGDARHCAGLTPSASPRVGLRLLWPASCPAPPYAQRWRQTGDGSSAATAARKVEHMPRRAPTTPQPLFPWRSAAHGSRAKATSIHLGTPAPRNLSQRNREVVAT
ncbi:hypothetical protein ERJ75_000888500 [Trypanosoma vivax]|nr:hypothetical protein ERJ75_000888500 [Trypanosoma vivax]